MAKHAKVLIVVNVDWFFLSHRLPIALAAQAQGYDVHIACGMTTKEDELRRYGFTVHPMLITRGRSNIQGELRTFLQMLRLMRLLRPDLVHLVTIKPVLFGGVAARWLNIHGVVVAISGLGFTYVARGTKASLKRWLVGFVYRFVLRKPNLRVIVQNSNDEAILRRISGLQQGSFLPLPGSGSDLSVFIPTALPDGVFRVVMACRLIIDKGVWEFVQAAGILKERGINVEMQLAGMIDLDNPMSLTEDDLARIRASGQIVLLGNRTDMANVFAACHAVTLPSFYGEGLPKVLIEAAACGRAIITTDMPGCRDAIEPDVTGILIPVRDATALADAIEKLAINLPLCAAMGEAGRRRAEQLFDVKHVVKAHLQVYDDLLGEY